MELKKKFTITLGETELLTKSLKILSGLLRGNKKWDIDLQ